MSALLRLYPREWRDRYEIEFREVLEMRRPGVRDRIDIVGGAIDARLHPEVPGQPDGPAPFRRLPIASITMGIAGVTFLAWVGLALRDFHGWDAGMPESAGMIMFLGFLASLALASSHVSIAYGTQSSMRAAGGPAASVAAIAFALVAFGVGSLALVGLLASAVLAWSVAGRGVPAWLSTVWAGSGVAAVAAFIAFGAGRGQEPGLFALLIPYGVTWLLMGLVTGLRGFPVVTPEAKGVDIVAP